eukprot:CAMPEP_0198130520 /NCGR_PEP_ID=MMETSP1442-20131203/54167_1 /TAXON_ID= /ORGANISM="Craspedostauros australis, Strain CCMP3328" /LENGTH=39 /DNA_ID= /DNA_START= /DNA_END= /DNA_ORIENTATION=
METNDHVHQEMKQEMRQADKNGVPRNNTRRTIRTGSKSC